LANKKISSLDALTSVATGDELVIVDKSDTTMAATGTTKKITQDNLIPDASATVKGKVELATDAETLAGTATTLATTPANLKSMILDEDDMASDSATKVPSQQSVKAYVDANATTDVTPKDGWIPVSDTWTYASASTITVPAGATAIYKKGDKIKLTQTTVKYFHIESVADTLLTIIVNSDYTLANEAITSPHYSHIANPVGFPSFFNWAGALTGFSNVGTATYRYSISGGVCTIGVFNTGGSSNATTKALTLPIASAIALRYPIYAINNGTGGHARADFAVSKTLEFFNGITGSTWTASGDCAIAILASYPI
jgi:hypothetical protein